MSNRYFNTKFWRDTYVDGLDPSEKLSFIYLFTNSEATICGMYELPLRMMSSDTGFAKDMLEDKLFPRFKSDKKAFYFKGWVCTTGTIKHQNTNNIKIRKGIKNELELVPEDVIEHFYKNGSKQFRATLDLFLEDKQKSLFHESRGELRDEIIETLEIPKSLITPDEPKQKKSKPERNIIPPTLEMVQKYKGARVVSGEQGAKRIDPQGFIDHYEVANWFRGKAKIKDWQACFRTWEKNNFSKPQQSGAYNPRQSDLANKAKKDIQRRDELREIELRSKDNDKLRKMKQDQKKLTESNLA